MESETIPLLVNPLPFTAVRDILIYNVFLFQIFDCGGQIFKQICFAPRISCIYTFRSNIDRLDGPKNVPFKRLKNRFNLELREVFNFS